MDQTSETIGHHINYMISMVMVSLQSNRSPKEDQQQVLLHIEPFPQSLISLFLDKF